MIKNDWRRSTLSCFFCGVDSGPALYFFLFLIGGALLASFCVLLWGLSKKKLQGEGASRIPLQTENIEE